MTDTLFNRDRQRREAMLLILNRQAQDYGLPPTMVVSIATYFSGLNPWCQSVPAEISRLHAPIPPCTRITESLGQDTRWGLMTLLGSQARDLGFRGAYLAELLDPDTNAIYGCKWLEQLRLRYFDSFGWEGVISAYLTGEVKFENGQFFNYAFVKAIRTGTGGVL